MNVLLLCYAAGGVCCSCFFFHMSSMIFSVARTKDYVSFLFEKVYGGLEQKYGHLTGFCRVYSRYKATFATAISQRICYFAPFKSMPSLRRQGLYTVQVTATSAFTH